MILRMKVWYVWIVCMVKGVGFLVYVWEELFFGIFFSFLVVCLIIGIKFSSRCWCCKLGLVVILYGLWYVLGKLEVYLIR